MDLRALGERQQPGPAGGGRGVEAGEISPCREEDRLRAVPEAQALVPAQQVAEVVERDQGERVAVALERRALVCVVGAEVVHEVRPRVGRRARVGSGVRRAERLVVAVPQHLERSADPEQRVVRAHRADLRRPGRVGEPEPVGVLPAGGVLDVRELLDRPVAVVEEVRVAADREPALEHHVVAARAGVERRSGDELGREDGGRRVDAARACGSRSRSRTRGRWRRPASRSAAGSAGSACCRRGCRAAAATRRGTRAFRRRRRAGGRCRVRRPPPHRCVRPSGPRTPRSRRGPSRGTRPACRRSPSRCSPAPPAVRRRRPRRGSPARRGRSGSAHLR